MASGFFTVKDGLGDVLKVINTAVAQAPRAVERELKYRGEIYSTYVQRAISLAPNRVKGERGRYKTGAMLESIDFKVSGRNTLEVWPLNNMPFYFKYQEGGTRGSRVPYNANASVDGGSGILAMLSLRDLSFRVVEDTPEIAENIIRDIFYRAGLFT